jgi:hypothetical protein
MQAAAVLGALSCVPTIVTVWRAGWLDRTAGALTVAAAVLAAVFLLAAATQADDSALFGMAIAARWSVGTMISARVKPYTAMRLHLVAAGAVLVTAFYYELDSITAFALLLIAALAMVAETVAWQETLAGARTQ